MMNINIDLFIFIIWLYFITDSVCNILLGVTGAKKSTHYTLLDSFVNLIGIFILILVVVIK